MTPRIWKAVAGAFAAALASAVLAGEPTCTAFVCTEADWPEMAAAAPAMEMEYHANRGAMVAVVQDHLLRDEAPVGHVEVSHAHRAPELYAAVDALDVEP